MKLSCLAFALVALSMYGCAHRSGSDVAHGSPADTTRLVVAAKLDPAIEKLLTHFKDNNNFPIVIDSLAMTKVNKGDSLGGKEVKLLMRKWKGDSTGITGYAVMDFYHIDSIKAKGLYSKYKDTLGPGMTKYANAYALYKTKLSDSATVLLWALAYSSYEADPGSDVVDVYYTMLYNGNLTETSILGEVSEFGDPPSAATGIIIGTLNKDGKILLQYSNEVDDLDSMRGEVTRARYDYMINGGKILFKGSKGEGVTEIKVKG